MPAGCHGYGLQGANGETLGSATRMTWLDWLESWNILEPLTMVVRYSQHFSNLFNTFLNRIWASQASDIEVGVVSKLASQGPRMRRGSKV